MVPPRKRPRKNRPSPPATDEWTLPTDVLLEIVARSDPATIVRCAAACKPLRRDVLDPSFIRRVTQPRGGIVPLSVLAYLHNRPWRNRKHNRSLGPLLSLVHPATPAASSFIDVNLAPYMSRQAFDILCRYDPLISRGGLVLLRRCYNVNMSRTSERWSDLCVFNPMTGDRTYLSAAPRLYPNMYYRYVLLSAADGVGCSFLLLATDVDCCERTGGVRITVQVAKTSETGSTNWGHVTSDSYHALQFRALQECRDPVILHGGIIHWLLSGGDQVLTYNIRTERLGIVMLPPTNCRESQRLIGRSPDGKLMLLTAKRFMVSVWLQVSHGWVKEAVIDVEQKLQSLHPDISPPRMPIEFQSSSERSGVVLFRAYRKALRPRHGPLVVFDLETKEMTRQEPNPYRQVAYPSLLFEVDLLAQLQAVKIFS